MASARLLAALIAPIFPASAAQLTFAGSAQVRLGYASNPFLQVNSPGGGAEVGGSIAPFLTRSTALGQTTLSGRYDREQYLKNYGHSDTIAANLQHRQRFSERLSGSIGGGYSSSLNPFLGGNINQTLPTVGPSVPVDNQPTPDQTAIVQPVVTPVTTDQSIIDSLTVGQRSRQLSGNAALDWVPGERDTVSVGANIVHSTYGRSRTGLAASNYDSYGANASYMRVLGPRRSVGLQLVVNRTDSGIYGSSTSYQPNFVLQQGLSQYWSFNGSVGVIFQHSPGPVGGWSKSVGFNGSLCGAYPRYGLCLTASRQSAASGIGGLRVTTHFGMSGNYRLTERSRITAAAGYDDSKSKTAAIFTGSQRFLQTSLDYSRDISRRMSVGFGGHYQWRDSEFIGKAHGFTGTINLSTSFGRTR